MMLRLPFRPSFAQMWQLTRSWAAEGPLHNSMVILGNIWVKIHMQATDEI